MGDRAWVAPIFLRIGIGVTFLWAGLGKLIDKGYTVQGEDAAILANMGVNVGPATPPQPKNIEPPAPVKEPPPDTKPDAKPDAAPAPAPADKAPAKGTDPAKAPARSLSGKKGGAPPPLLMLADPRQPAAAPGPHTMAEYPEPRSILRVYSIALLIHERAHPAPDAAGHAPASIVPEWAASGAWPVRLAWTCAVAETLCGTLLLVGLFTRISALVLVGNIGVAAWLAVIGPAIQSGNTRLGFLPAAKPYDEVFSHEWTTPLFLLTLLMTALGLLCTGAGGLSLDSVIFASAPKDVLRPEPKAKADE